MSQVIEIDGSYGEGGGQILRTALSLSCLTGKPFRLFNIRNGRKKPGLMPQHIASVRAAGTVTGADIRGAEYGSMDLTFKPGKIRGGDFFFDIGTAGSSTLVLQTILPSLLFSKGCSSIKIRGGTHVPFSPSFNYLSEVFIPYLEKMGINLKIEIKAHGFYPKGGGLITAKVSPSFRIKPLRVEGRGQVLSIKGYSCVSNLPMTIAERQRTSFIKRLSSQGFPAEIDLLSVNSPGEGTFLFVMVISENAVAGFTSLSAKGKRAEDVGEEAADEILKYLSTDAALDQHLPDQIALYTALCKEESVITTSSITEHLLTNLWVIEKFLDFNYIIIGKRGEPGLIRFNGQDILARNNVK